MSAHVAGDVSTDSAGDRVARLLAAPRYEIMPFRGVEGAVGELPAGSRVTVTASPSHGLMRTIEVAERLAASGYEVIPHLSARMVSGRRELIAIVERLAAAGIDQAFVVGGDASPPAGPYHEAGDLLDELAGLDHPFTRIGIGGYPEGHPLIADDKLLEALRRKQPHAAYVVTQLCFDAGVLAGLGADDPGRRASTCPWSSGCPAWSSGASWPRYRSKPASAPRCATCVRTAVS